MMTGWGMAGSASEDTKVSTDGLEDTRVTTAGSADIRMMMVGSAVEDPKVLVTG